MANDLRGRVWTLDTAAADFSDETTAWKHRVCVSAISFEEYAADADVAELRDVNGRTIVKFDGAGTLEPVILNFTTPQWFNGLRLHSITAGAVRVHLC